MQSLLTTLLYSTHRPAATSSSLAALKRDGSHIASCSEVKQITSTFVRTCTAYATAGIITSTAQHSMHQPAIVTAVAKEEQRRNKTTHNNLQSEQHRTAAARMQSRKRMLRICSNAEQQPDYSRRGRQGRSGSPARRQCSPRGLEWDDEAPASRINAYTINEGSEPMRAWMDDEQIHIQHDTTAPSSRCGRKTRTRTRLWHADCMWC